MTTSSFFNFSIFILHLGHNSNSSECTFDVTVEDTIAPVLTCPNVFAECSGPDGTMVTFSPTVNDACDPAPSLTYMPPAGTAFLPGMTSVTCTANWPAVVSAV